MFEEKKESLADKIQKDDNRFDEEMEQYDQVLEELKRDLLKKDK